jgi:phospholipid-binding lipoprotein MlaA
MATVEDPGEPMSKGDQVRSRLRMQSTGLMIGLLALALTGCGTFSGGTARPVLVGAPVVGTTEPTAAPQTPEPVAAALPAETRAPAEAPTPRAADLATEAGKPAVEFVPVALEPAPSGTGALLAYAGSPDSLPVQTAALPAPVVAQSSAATAPADVQIEEYDPWEKFNEKMFTFNYNFDKYLLKPVAKGYNFVMPDRVQQMIGHGFDNINVVPKLVNNLLQLKWKGFGTELGRFLINSTFGIGGLFDIAKQEFGLEKTKVDFGQTLGKWGVAPGPYLILPFLPPLTVRDGIGYAADGAMDPLSYVLPFIWDRLGMKIGDTINDRSLNLDLFQGFEETTVDLYSAVRNGYLQRRYNLIHGQ